MDSQPSYSHHPNDPWSHIPDDTTTTTEYLMYGVLAGSLCCLIALFTLLVYKFIQSTKSDEVTLISEAAAGSSGHQTSKKKGTQDEAGSQFYVNEAFKGVKGPQQLISMGNLPIQRVKV